MTVSALARSRLGGGFVDGDESGFEQEGSGQGKALPFLSGERSCGAFGVLAQAINLRSL
jgi:hypothetical protein